MPKRRKGIFLSHASEDKREIVDPLIECLENGGIQGIWYDKREIQTGQSIIQMINQGLANSKMGIVVLTPNFIEKPFSTWELDCLVYHMIYNKIRLIPLLKNISRERILEMYPLMSPLLFKEIGECDNELIQHIKQRKLKGTSIVDNPNSEIASGKRTKAISNKLEFKTQGIDEKILAKICVGIQKDSVTKELNITKLRSFASKRKIWIHRVSWDIIEFLIFSKEEADSKNWLFVIGEMVKLARLEKSYFVLRNVEELFLFKLLEFSDPLNKKRVSHDALEILEIILDSNAYFEICVSAIIRAMEDIVEEQKYTSYMQFFFYRISIYKSKRNITLLINRLEKLVESHNLVARTRAADFAKIIIQDY